MSEGAGVRHVIDTDDARLDPAWLEELAALLRRQRWERAARIAELSEAPALGWHRRRARILAGEPT